MLSMGLEAEILFGLAASKAKTTIAERHYTRSVPSGKTVCIAVDAALVLFSIPANQNIASFLGFSDVWELSRLWAPDGHDRNLLSQAISAATREFHRRFPEVEAIVSYADPSAGHHGGVYKAASWCFDGQSDEGRGYRGESGEIVSRRAFHSGGSSMTRAEIEARGFAEIKTPGNLRFVKPLGKKSQRMWRKRNAGFIAEQSGIAKPMQASLQIEMML